MKIGTIESKSLNNNNNSNTIYSNNQYLDFLIFSNKCIKQIKYLSISGVVCGMNSASFSLVYIL